MPDKKQRGKLLQSNCCAMCGKSKDKTKTLCESCLVYKRDWSRQKRDERFKNGLCTYCGKKPSKTDRRRCQDCHDKLAPKSLIKRKKYNSRNLLLKKHRKQRVMDYYGGKCLCCGETGLLFLAIDHIDGNGAEHRRQIAPNHKCRGPFGDLFYRWLEKNNYPSGFQTLCHNCNIAKSWNGGICPHKQANDCV